MNKGKIKILYILTKSGIGGAQKYVADLAKNLDKNKFESKIIYGEKDIKWLSNKTYPWFLFINDWLAVFELIKIFKKEKPDTIHLNSSKTGVLGSLAVFFYKLKTKDYKLKTIFTAHGWVFNPTNELGWVARQFFIILHKFAAMFQDKIICVSGYDYDLALQYDICEPEKLIKIHNGIDTNMKFLSKKEARSELIEKLQTFNQQLKINVPWIGSVGRLVKEKNYETFIEAAKLVPNAYFFIIGEGPELEKLNVRCQMLNVVDRFFIIPPIGNDARYLKAFDIFIMSSVKEGLPYILLEAMVAELPIVITEAGGMPELIKNHESGLMVAQRNPEALARATSGLIENRVIAKELSQKAKEVVIERFNIKKMVSETERVYNS